jgi:Major intrinsic protein
VPASRQPWKTSRHSRDFSLDFSLVEKKTWLAPNPSSSSSASLRDLAIISSPWLASSWERSSSCMYIYLPITSIAAAVLANRCSHRFFAFAGTQVANTPQTTAGSQSTDLPQGPDPSQLLYISLCFGFSLAVNAWVFYRISGGLFNPAVCWTTFAAKEL